EFLRLPVEFLDGLDLRRIELIEDGRQLGEQGRGLDGLQRAGVRAAKGEQVLRQRTPIAAVGVKAFKKWLEGRLPLGIGRRRRAKEHDGDQEGGCGCETQSENEHDVAPGGGEGCWRRKAIVRRGERGCQRVKGGLT